MQLFSCQSSERYICKGNYEIEIVILEEIYISGLELERWSLEESIISFSKIYIWDFEVRFGKFHLGPSIKNLI
jgi:hypothetical protein